jgi:hypothetical protein
METISTAKAVQNFIDRIDFSLKVKNNNATIIQAISSRFTVEGPIDFLIHAQFSNIHRLSVELRHFQGIRPEAKEKYQTSLNQLMRLFQYPVLYQNAEAARKDIVEPNHWVLPVLDDRLGSYSTIDDQAKTDILALAQKLLELEREISDSNIEPRLKAILLPMLSQLSTLLKNYEIVGFEKAWEIASAALFTVHKFSQKQVEPTQGDASWLARTAVTIAAVVGILTTVDTGVKHAASIGSQAKEFYEFIQKSEQLGRPRIEHRKE